MGAEQQKWGESHPRSRKHHPPRLISVPDGGIARLLLLSCIAVTVERRAINKETASKQKDRLKPNQKARLNKYVHTENFAATCSCINTHIIHTSPRTIALFLCYEQVMETFRTSTLASLSIWPKVWRQTALHSIPYPTPTPIASLTDRNQRCFSAFAESHTHKESF